MFDVEEKIEGMHGDVVLAENCFDQSESSSEGTRVSKYDILKERMLMFLRDNEQLKDELFELHLSLKQEKEKREDLELQTVSLHKHVEKVELENEELRNSNRDVLRSCITFNDTGERALNDRLRSSEKKYSEMAHAASIAERERKSLEQKTFNDEERINSLEIELKDFKLVSSLASSRIEELSDSLGSAKSKLEFYEQRCIHVEDNLKQVEQELVDSSRAATIIAQRFTNSEEEIENLKTEYAKAMKLASIHETRSEATQIEYEKLQKQMTDLETKLEREEETCRRLQIEMETYMHDVSSL